MTQKRWKVGLLGAGFICSAHAKALKCRTDIEIVAICDQSRCKAQAVSSLFGIPQVFSSLDELLAAEVDVIHVLLPPDKHMEATRRILESGRHAFLEKPMGLVSLECQELVDLARAKGVKLGVDHNFLFLPAAEKLRRHAADGTLGTLDHVTISWLYPLGLIQFGPFNNWMLRDPKNLLFELGPHLVAFQMDLLGPLDQLQTFVSRPIDLPGGGRVYRHWHIRGHKGPTEVNLFISLVSGPSDRSVSVRGSAALAKCYFDRGLYLLEEPIGYGLFDNFSSVIDTVRQLFTNGVRNLFSSVTGTLRKGPTSDTFGESIAGSINRFYDSIDGELDSRLDGQFGVNVIAECERIVASAAFEPQTTERPTWTVVPPTKPPTVLVLGGTGFIGQYLVRALVAKGLGVRVVTRGLSSAQIALAGLPVELAQGDLADPTFMDAVLENIDVVYDLAKAVGEKWEDYYQQDVLVTKNIAERALGRGVKRFIYTGTIASHYTANADDVITSDTPLDPKITRRNHYARSKAMCEGLLVDMYHKNSFPVVILRPGIVIGKGNPPAHWGVGAFTSDTQVQYWGAGQHKLPFVLVEDVADALVLAFDKPGIEGQSFLLTSEPLLSGEEYVKAVSEASRTQIRTEVTHSWKLYLGELVKEGVKHLIRHPNRRVPSYRDVDAKSNRARFDSSKAIEVLGWSPVATAAELIERGIKEPVRNYMR